MKILYALEKKAYDNFNDQKILRETEIEIRKIVSEALSSQKVSIRYKVDLYNKYKVGTKTININQIDNYLIKLSIKLVIRYTTNSKRISCYTLLNNLLTTVIDKHKFTNQQYINIEIINYIIKNNIEYVLIED